MPNTGVEQRGGNGAGTPSGVGTLGSPIASESGFRNLPETPPDALRDIVFYDIDDTKAVSAALAIIVSYKGKERDVLPFLRAAVMVLTADPKPDGSGERSNETFPHMTGSEFMDYDTLTPDEQKEVLKHYWSDPKAAKA